MRPLPSARRCALAAVLTSVQMICAQKPVRLNIASDVTIGVKEPSDMTTAGAGPEPLFHVVSDNGSVHLMDVHGRVRRSSAVIAYDLEGCMRRGADLLLIDERARRIIWVDTASYQVKRSLTFPYFGARNKAYEAIAWNASKERYLLVTERDPILILELDTSFRVVNEVYFDRSVRDISSAQWHDGHVWLLSDMDMELLKCDPQDYGILARYALPVINPEGFEFGTDGALWVISDDRQKLYSFQLP